jgi:hypothetical protein
MRLRLTVIFKFGSTFISFGQAKTLIVNIKTDTIFFNNYILKDSINLHDLEKELSEKPKITYFLSKQGKDKLVNAKTKKVLWQKIEFKDHGIQVYRIVENIDRIQKPGFALLQVFPNQTTMLNLNNKSIDLNTLTCIKADSLIKTTFVDNYWPHSGVDLLSTGSNGKYLLSFIFKKCDKISYTSINLPFSEQ